MDTNINTDIPRVSIVMATYNQARFIGHAIESVLAQSFTDWELLILDDASTDETPTIVNNFILKEKNTPRGHNAQNIRGLSRIKYIRQPHNTGIANNRNTALAHCRGTYIAVLDSDDIWLDSRKLAEQIDYLDAHPDCGLVGTWATTKIISTDHAAVITKMEPATKDTAIRAMLLFQNQFIHSSVLIRREAIDKIAINKAKNIYYDPARRIGEDYDLWLRIGLHYKLANIPKHMTIYGIHNAGITKQKRRRADWDHLALIIKYGRSYPLKKGFGAGLSLLRKRLFNQP